jgi:hypothetical protein
MIRRGTTNGAAMRIAPIGIATPADDLDALVDVVVQASHVTHNTSLGIAASSAVAAAVSTGLDGADLSTAFDQAERAAAIGAQRGHWSAGGEIAARIQWARAWVRGMSQAAVADAVAALTLAAEIDGDTTGAGDTHCGVRRSTRRSADQLTSACRSTRRPAPSDQRPGLVSCQTLSGSPNASKAARRSRNTPTTDSSPGSRCRATKTCSVIRRM